MSARLSEVKPLIDPLRAIKDAGVAERDVQTAALSLQPQYESTKPGAPRLIGFQVSNQVTVKIRDIKAMPGVLDRAISAGANEMSGIDFVVSARRACQMPVAPEVVDGLARAVIAGRVTTADAKPIGCAEVTAYIGSTRVATAIARPDGAYTIERLRGATYALEFQAAGYVTRQLGQRRRSSGERLGCGQFDLPVVGGTIRDVRGRGRSGAHA